MQHNATHAYLWAVSCWKDALLITPAAIGGAVDISLQELDNLSDSSG